MYPIVAKLSGRKVVVVGAGRVGTRRIKALLEAEARVTVVSPEATDEVTQLAVNDRIEWKSRRFRRTDIRRATLVVAATDSPAVNARVFRLCERVQCLVNSIDDPDHCSFYTPATIRRGDLLIALSTSGSAPYLSRRLKAHLDDIFPVDFGDIVADIAERRRAILREAPDDESERTRLVRNGIDEEIDRAIARLAK